MATFSSAQPLSLIVPSLASLRTSRGVLTSKPVAFALFVLMIIVSAEAQTFQYSRGWTNGKRNGGVSPLGLSPYEAIESGLVDPMDVIIPPGRLQMNLVPKGRFRSVDYNQFLAKRMGVSGSGNFNARKQPLWFGTILGLDGADSLSVNGVSSGANANSNSNTNTVPSSRSSSSDF